MTTSVASASATLSSCCPSTACSSTSWLLSETETVFSPTVSTLSTEFCSIFSSAACSSAPLLTFSLISSLCSAICTSASGSSPSRTSSLSSFLVSSVIVSDTLSVSCLLYTSPSPRD
eukprot:TRINITY_DN15975_c0_g1_i1.p1 TRINITY_DN15975_c0_g1~~TRINITY_DN15975_c0_g1_i1.p1  ORF type:complete len:117 (-),score=2.84 TRINITY_DN15975_c0_g1_i1:7-357(-)